MPNIQFTGQNYEVGGNNAILASIIGYVRMFIFALICGGDLIVGNAMRRMPDGVKDAYTYM
jgi:hypothetical protein|tara:strand:- start:359 stop:541 length:183 start_codon:yes stop_codon:yes gene_type:complete